MRERILKALSPMAVLNACAIFGIAGIGVSVWLICWQLTFGVVGTLLLMGGVYGAWRMTTPPSKRHDQ
jgi:hypothetical protein